MLPYKSPGQITIKSAFLISSAASLKMKLSGESQILSRELFG